MAYTRTRVNGARWGVPVTSQNTRFKQQAREWRGGRAGIGQAASYIIYASSERPLSARHDVFRRTLSASAFARSSVCGRVRETVTFKIVECWPVNVPGHTVRMPGNREGPIHPRPRPWRGTLYENHSIVVCTDRRQLPHDRSTRTAYSGGTVPRLDN